MIRYHWNRNLNTADCPFCFRGEHTVLGVAAVAADENLLNSCVSDESAPAIAVLAAATMADCDLH